MTSTSAPAPAPPATSAPAPAVTWAVSVEGLRVPARQAVLKALQARLGLVPVCDDDRADRGADAFFRVLLHRVRALARVPPGSHALWTGSWVLTAPRDPDPRLAALHRQLGEALVARLAPGRRVRHLMLCLDACPHEAFEAALGGDPGAHREVDLRALAGAAAGLARAEPGPGSPFPCEVARVACPRFAGDNPATLEALLDLSCDAVKRVRAPG